MALQELDLEIKYLPGRGNQKADALSHYLVSLLRDDESTPVVVAAVEALTNSMNMREGDVT